MQNQPLNQSGGIERFHGLDAARAIALLIGIFHHGIESFVSYVKWDWVTQDSQSSTALDVLFYISHVFRMQAFFLMSGFFANLLLTRKGLREFIINRTKRLLLPFVIFWPLIYAATYYLWVWGITYLKHIPFEKAVTKLPDYMIWSKGFPLMHLWFLYFLILFCACVTLAIPIFKRIDKNSYIQKEVDKFLSWCLNKWWGSLLIGVFMMIPMLWMKDWFGVDTSSSGLLPRIASLTIYGMYFTLGWFVFRQTSLLKSIERFRLINFITGIILILLLIAINLIFADPSPEDANHILMTLNIIYAFASITSVFAFVGYMLSWFSSPGTSIRYLSDGSYWGYLIHLPLIAFFQIIVAPYNWFWGIKLLLIFIPSIIILVISYHYGVRNTAIGMLLNGVKKRVN